MSTELEVAPLPFWRREGKYTFLGTQVAFACTTYSAMVFDATKNFAQYTKRHFPFRIRKSYVQKGIFGNEIPRNN